MLLTLHFGLCEGQNLLNTEAKPNIWASTVSARKIVKSSVLICDTIRDDVTSAEEIRRFMVCSALLATFISDYEYEIEFEYEFSN